MQYCTYRATFVSVQIFQMFSKICPCYKLVQLSHIWIQGSIMTAWWRWRQIFLQLKIVETWTSFTFSLLLLNWNQTLCIIIATTNQICSLLKKPISYLAPYLTNKVLIWYSLTDKKIASHWLQVKCPLEDSDIFKCNILLCVFSIAPLKEFNIIQAHT